MTGKARAHRDVAPPPLNPDEHGRLLVSLVVNRHRVERHVAPETLLLDFLRDDLGFTGTKRGCGNGVCGACSVIVDGELTSACLTFVFLVAGKTVRTVEGLASADGVLSPLQRSFVERGGFQCGFCTPGQLMAATALLAEDAAPTTDAVAKWLEGNLCRCTGYYKIVDAVVSAADGATGHQ